MRHGPLNSKSSALRRKCAASFFCAALLLATLRPTVDASGAQEVTPPRHLETMKSLRWRGVVRQAYDYSCGTGSIANLLALVGVEPPDERALIEQYTKSRGAEAVQSAMQAGFSLLDLKRMLDALGYKTAGMRYEAGTMPEDPQPMIVYLVVKGYKHFAVFAGVEQGQVVLRDPARGHIRMTQERFLSEWDGTALCLTGKEANTPLPNDQLERTYAQDAARQAIFHP